MKEKRRAYRGNYCFKRKADKRVGTPPNSKVTQQKIALRGATKSFAGLEIR